MQYNFTARSETGKLCIFNTDPSADGRSVRLTLPREQLEEVNQLYALGDFTRAAAGDEGFYVASRNIGMSGDPLTRFLPREDMEYAYGGPVFSAFGVKKTRDRLCALVRIERNYKYRFLYTVRDGIYRLEIKFDFTKHDAPYDDLRMEIFFLSPEEGYAAMAALDRRIGLERGEIVPLADKCRRPAVEYARKYPLIRVRMGWKPSPSPVAHQTPENEPDMLAACTFGRVRDLADELRAQGVEGAELQLVGWNIGGHDGRYPQLFPVDARLGGEAELRRTIEYVKSLGFRISLHTNLIDSYEIADTFTWDDAAVTRDGEYAQIGHYSAGDAYHVCPHRQMKNCLRDMPALRDFGLNGLHYIDVMSIAEPDDCHNPDHPCTTAQGIGRMREIMQYVQDNFGGFSSEGGFDFANPGLDYALYVCFGAGFGVKQIPIMDEELPLYELIYHGTLLYNPSSPTINYPIKPAADRLTFFMRGGHPSFYIYSKFRTGGALNWMGEDDLTIRDNTELKRTVSVIAASLREYAPLADRQFIPMTDYSIRDGGLHEAVYEDGVRMIGNFTDAAQTFEGHEIGPWGWILL